jgi:uncharacterized membrane protein YGL010W
MKNPIAQWYSRHRNPVSFWLHAVGIPACFVAAPILLVLHLWWPAAGSFVGGYILQLVGHAIEGSPSGEAILLRRLLGRDRTKDA